MIIQIRPLSTQEEICGVEQLQRDVWDLPNIEVVLLETPVPGVPYGVRGVAEMPIVPVAAAIANAVRRATGVRMTQMPMTPERVQKAIRNSRG